MKRDLPDATRALNLNPLKCNGCKECEIACSVKRFGLNDPSLSSIRIVSEEGLVGFHFPVVCFQCSDAPCMAACPVEAIYRDEQNRVMIRNSVCVGCRFCVAACPFGAMGFDSERGRAFKCDLCGGDPECLRRCEPKALSFVRPYEPAAVSAQGAARRYLESAAGGLL